MKTSDRCVMAMSDVQLKCSNSTSNNKHQTVNSRRKNTSYTVPFQSNFNDGLQIISTRCKLPNKSNQHSHTFADFCCCMVSLDIFSSRDPNNNKIKTNRSQDKAEQIQKFNIFVLLIFLWLLQEKKNILSEIFRLYFNVTSAVYAQSRLLIPKCYTECGIYLCQIA